MKKVWVLIVLLLIIYPLYLFADNIPTKGFKLGLNIANVYGELDSTESTTGLAVGAFFRKPLSNNFSIQPEVYYSQKGYITPSDSLSSEARYSLNYLEVPVLFIYTIPKTNFGLFAGPYISIFLNGSITLNIWGIDISLDIPAGEMTPFDVGVVFGGMYSIKKFFVDTHASLGFTNFPSDDSNMKNDVFQISGGLQF